MTSVRANRRGRLLGCLGQPRRDGCVGPQSLEALGEPGVGLEPLDRIREREPEVGGTNEDGGCRGVDDRDGDRLAVDGELIKFPAGRQQRPGQRAARLHELEVDARAAARHTR